jgi:hypothetical protein
MKKRAGDQYLILTGLMLQKGKLSKSDLQHLREMDSRIMKYYHCVNDYEFIYFLEYSSSLGTYVPIVNIKNSSICSHGSQ